MGDEDLHNFESVTVQLFNNRSHKKRIPVVFGSHSTLQKLINAKVTDGAKCKILTSNWTACVGVEDMKGQILNFTPNPLM